METKIKTDLFRFMTLRGPQLISKDRRALGFIEHFDPSSSHFLNLIQNESDLDVARSTLTSATSGVDPIDSVAELKVLNTEIWDFSMWLNKNRNSLTVTLIGEMTIPALPDASERLTIWDNLFYEILSKRNPYIRQACLQLLVTYNFIEHQAAVAQDDQTLRRLANGKVIIHPAFTVKKQTEADAVVNPQTTSFTSTPNRRRMGNQLESFISREEIEDLENLKEEFVDLDVQYKNEYQTAFDADFQTYATATEAIVATYIEDNGLSESAGGATEGQAEGETEAEQAEPLSLEQQLPEGLVDDFTFDFDGPLSPEFTTGKLSDKGLDFIQKNRLEDKNIDFALSIINKDLAKKKKNGARRTKQKTKKMLINGVIVEAKSARGYNNSFAFGLKTDDFADTRLYFALDTNYDGLSLSNANFTLVIDDETFVVENLAQSEDNGDTLYGYLESSEVTKTLIQTKIGKNFILTGEIQTSNGKTFTVALQGIVRNMANGRIAHSTALESLDVEGGDSPQNTVIHYGINRIGVADFRRVEQELCCYVPGEVSHIENILAKEYKERSTRNLISTEVTRETSTEREMEEISDTTSTSRHDMSNEISEVLNKDRSLNVGFNANFSKGTDNNGVSLGTNTDLAFSQSSSKSNAMARNYAEDVTRRALERIVQKTSSRRTSRILREFEENNRHGFDNREGDKHVTGIYRWIDKVYKNRLVNYGKRLMYEFTIPEPARGYKELIIKDIEENDKGGTSLDSKAAILVEPVKPKLDSPNDITRGNYIDIAAQYRADVQAPKEKEIKVTFSKVESIGNNDKAHSFNYSDLYVPQDYIGKHAGGNILFHYKSRTKPRGFLKLSVAGQNKTIAENLRGSHNSKTTIGYGLHDAENAIPISLSTRKITSFNLALEVRCLLKESVYKQWQQETYDAIMDAYEAQMRVFNEAAALAEEEEKMTKMANEKNEPNKITSNSAFNADIINREIKRLCIEIMLKPFGIQQGQNFYAERDCNIPEILQNEQLDIHASKAQFFEQAFDWQIMSYIFYPYYWADCKDWKSLFQSQNGTDHIFRAFLQSGLSKITVPVQPGFEDAVAYYMETGEIWNGNGMVIETDDELYLSIVDEVTNIDGQVEDEWETVVPTTLTIVQARSAFLDEEGLPCCETDAEFLASMSIKPDTNVLELLQNQG